MNREFFPERIPFRLTRMIINAMEVSGIEGTFRITCEKDMKVFQVLRGNSPQDSFNRKMMMKKFKISKDAIDT